MNLKDVGEFGLISRLFQRDCPRIGDDCALIGQTLVTTDMLVEGTHFKREYSSAADIGYKSLAVNLSDIASKGGEEPLYAFLSMSLPTDLPLEWVEEFCTAFLNLAKAHKVELAGGDTVRGNVLAFNITLTADLPLGRNFKSRANARSGDVIAVTGPLGDSAAGLTLLQQGSDDKSALIQRHLRPRITLKEGQFLAASPCVNAMMDLSDGIGSDLGHILRASKISGAVIESLPLSSDLEPWPNAMNLALFGGEDYELLATVEEKSFSLLSQEFHRQFGRPLYRVGQVLQGTQGICMNGAEIKSLGYDAFREGL